MRSFWKRLYGALFAPSLIAVVQALTFFLLFYCYSEIKDTTTRVENLLPAAAGIFVIAFVFVLWFISRRQRLMNATHSESSNSRIGYQTPQSKTVVDLVKFVGCHIYPDLVAMGLLLGGASGYLAGAWFYRSALTETSQCLPPIPPTWIVIGLVSGLAMMCIFPLVGVGGSDAHALGRSVLPALRTMLVWVLPLGVVGGLGFAKLTNADDINNGIWYCRSPSLPLNTAWSGALLFGLLTLAASVPLVYMSPGYAQLSHKRQLGGIRDQYKPTVRSINRGVTLATVGFLVAVGALIYSVGFNAVSRSGMSTQYEDTWPAGMRTFALGILLVCATALELVFFRIITSRGFLHYQHYWSARGRVQALSIRLLYLAGKAAAALGVVFVLSGFLRMLQESTMANLLGLPLSLVIPAGIACGSFWIAANRAQHVQQNEDAFSRERFNTKIATGLSELLKPTYFAMRFSIGPLASGSVRAHKEAGAIAIGKDNQPVYLVVSDMHRGKGDLADDFRQTRWTYLQILKLLNPHSSFDSGAPRDEHIESLKASVHDMRFEKATLLLNGDVEELWEEEYEDITHHYSENFKLEKELCNAEVKRLLRTFGNHDIDYRYPDHIALRRLQGEFPELPLWGDPSCKRMSVSIVPELIRIKVTHNDETVGEFLVTHGHQGEDESDKYEAPARWIVRNVWGRTIQGVFGVSRNAFPPIICLGTKNDRAMAEWAREENMRRRQSAGSYGASHPIALVAGHTHWPYIWQPDHPRSESDKPRLTVYAHEPSYFNSGCAAYTDGSITGLYIDSQQVVLLRFYMERESLRLQELGRLGLADVFGRLGASVPVAGEDRISVRVDRPTAPMRSVAQGLLLAALVTQGVRLLWKTFFHRR